MSSSSFLWLNCLHRQNDCFLTMLCMCMYVIYSGRDDTSQVLKRNMSKILYYNWLVFISWTIPLCEKYKRLMWKIGNFKFSCQNIKCRKKNNSYLIPFHFAIVKVSLSLSIVCKVWPIFQEWLTWKCEHIGWLFRSQLSTIHLLFCT